MTAKPLPWNDHLRNEFKPKDAYGMLHMFQRTALGSLSTREVWVEYDGVSSTLEWHDPLATRLIMTYSDTSGKYPLKNKSCRISNMKEPRRVIRETQANDDVGESVFCAPLAIGRPKPLGELELSARTHLSYRRIGIHAPTDSVVGTAGGVSEEKELTPVCTHHQELKQERKEEQYRLSLCLGKREVSFFALEEDSFRLCVFFFFQIDTYSFIAYTYMFTLYRWKVEARFCSL